MVKELLLPDKKEIQFSKIETNEIQKDSEKNAQFQNGQYSDTISWVPHKEFLLVKYSRSANFSSSRNFKITIEYQVQHYLKSGGSLDSLSNEDFRTEILQDPNYYVQSDKGTLAKVSMLISQITEILGGPPLVLPPVILPFSNN